MCGDVDENRVNGGILQAEEKPRYSEEIENQFQFIRQKSHMDCPGVKQRAPEA